MQVGQPVAVGLVDEERVDVGDVQPVLDDRGRQQDIVSPVDEIDHHLFEVALGHLSVRDGQFGLWDDLSEPGSDVLDVLYAVVDEEDLSATAQFPHHCVADQLAIEPRDSGFDGQAIFRWRLKVGDVAQAQQPHVQRPRNGRGGHRQHVDGSAERLQAILHLDAEPLLLVDDHQPQVLKLHVLLCQPVGADDDVDLPGCQAADDGGLLLAGGETREGGDLERKLGHSFGEGAMVLLGEDRGGHQYGHLVPGIDRPKRRPHRHLRLPIAHVPAKQPVHRPRFAHVVLDGVDGEQLVVGFLIWERGVELALPLGVHSEADPRP